MADLYKEKYLKYKNKYIALQTKAKNLNKSQVGGSVPEEHRSFNAPVVACPGNVNAQPSVIVPGKNQEGGSVPVVSCPGIVNAQPVVVIPSKSLQGGSVPEVNEVVNTPIETKNVPSVPQVEKQQGGTIESDEIKTLVEQFGGKKKKRSSPTESLFDSSSEVLLFSSDSLSLSDSVSDSDFDKNL